MATRTNTHKARKGTQNRRTKNSRRKPKGTTKPTRKALQAISNRVYVFTDNHLHNFYASAYIYQMGRNVPDPVKRELIYYIESFANRLLSIAKLSSGQEISKHAHDGGCSGDNNYELMPLAKRENSKAIRKTFGSLSKMRQAIRSRRVEQEKLTKLFQQCVWNTSYGGKAWWNVSRTIEDLEKLLPIVESNLGEVIRVVDRLIDLEHNNDLFLQNYYHSEEEYLGDNRFLWYELTRKSNAITIEEACNRADVRLLNWAKRFCPKVN